MPANKNKLELTTSEQKSKKPKIERLTLAEFRENSAFDDSFIGRWPLALRVEILKFLTDKDIGILSRVSRVFYNWVHALNSAGNKPNEKNPSFYDVAKQRRSTLVNAIMAKLEHSFRFEFEKEHKDLWFKGIHSDESLNAFNKFIDVASNLVTEHYRAEDRNTLAVSYQATNHPLYNLRYTLINSLAELLKSLNIPVTFEIPSSEGKKFAPQEMAYFHKLEKNADLGNALKNISPLVAYALNHLCFSSRDQFIKIMEEMCENHSLNIMRWLDNKKIAIKDSQIQTLWRNNISTELTLPQQNILVEIFRMDVLYWQLSEIARVAKNLDNKELNKFLKVLQKLFKKDNQPYAARIGSSGTTLLDVFQFSKIKIPHSKGNTNFLQALTHSMVLFGVLEKAKISLNIEWLMFGEVYAETIGKLYAMKASALPRTNQEIAALFPKLKLQPKVHVPETASSQQLSTNGSYQFVVGETGTNNGSLPTEQMVVIDASQGHVLTPAVNDSNQLEDSGNKEDHSASSANQLQH